MVIMTSGRYNLYSLHISNLPAGTSEGTITDIFNAAGEVVEVYLSPKVRSDSHTIYAFVRYRTKEEAFQGVKLLNNITVEGAQIKVELSSSTEERVSGARRHFNSNKSIVRNEMPRMERSRFTVLPCDERHIHMKLKSSINMINKDQKICEDLGISTPEGKLEFQKDLKDIIVKISSVPYGVSVDPINFGSEMMDKAYLQNLILRYHDPPTYEVPFKDVDLDISDNDLLTNAERKKLFKFLPD